MFTEDLIAEILLRLPVKSILRCKAVCKPWLSLISSPNLIKSQLRHAITRPGADQILVHCETDHYDDDLISLLHVESCQVGAPLGLPYSRGDLSFEPVFRIIGSCCGLVCVSVSNFPTPRLVDGVWRFLEINRNPDIYVWNPATKHSKLIHPPNICY